jgi:hypothetical protein
VVVQSFPIDEIVPKAGLVCPPFSDDHQPNSYAERQAAISVDTALK